jgi:hypothetical protein
VDRCDHWRDSGGRRVRPARQAGDWRARDLLDVIRKNCGLLEFGDVLAEARHFLSLPRPEHEPESISRIAPAPIGSPESARRLFAISSPIHGTIAETHLRARGISALHEAASLRFHPRKPVKTCRRRHGPP